MKQLTLITVFIFTLSSSNSDVAIQKSAMYWLDRKQTPYDNTNSIDVMLFYSMSCFNCINKEFAGLEDTAWFIYQTQPLSTKARLSVIQRFEKYGINKDKVILYYVPEETEYFKNYEMGRLRLLDSNNYKLSFN